MQNKEIHQEILARFKDNFNILTRFHVSVDIMHHDTTKSVNKQLISSKWKSSNGFAGGVNQNTVFSFSVAAIRSSVGRYDTKCRKMCGYVEQWFSMKSHKAFSHVDNYSYKKSWSIVSEGCNALYSNISH